MSLTVWSKQIDSNSDIIIRQMCICRAMVYLVAVILARVSVNRQRIADGHSTERQVSH